MQRRNIAQYAGEANVGPRLFARCSEVDFQPRGGRGAPLQLAPCVRQLDLQRPHFADPRCRRRVCMARGSGSATPGSQPASKTIKVPRREMLQRRTHTASAAQKVCLGLCCG